MAVASATKENLHKSGSSPSRSSKQEAESAPETSSVHSGYASNRRDVDVATSGSEEYRLLFRLPLDELLKETKLVVLRGYTAENIEWLEKCVDYLKEEMLMVETRIERMHHEHAMLKAHLQSLERPMPK